MLAPNNHCPSPLESPWESFSTTTSLSQGLASGAYKLMSTSLLKCSGTSTSSIPTSMGLSPRDVTGELERTISTNFDKVEKMRLKAVKELHKQQHACAKLMERDSSSHVDSKTNWEYYNIELELSEVKLMLYDATILLKEDYCNVIQHVKLIEDPYNTRGELEALQAQFDALLLKLDDSLKKVLYLTMQRDMLVQSKERLSLSWREWFRYKRALKSHKHSTTQHSRQST
ncbi:uncharacterized protein CYBJADRAFT_172439 [Cyberlindnera jadinii NRRL Y-1542]|uniref:Uncharacterized protein n=1 Tax=Cyberlindnera jadinii (strain ATCC 18201 / CBS 1600 / BCRC 20928 / JCM 3617 / NBRC 0987 / NRRL Y-1542) TaxID=983966 RepID=A0A1E4S4Y8_CYBJN|nr:hypothetical protein CYBJADRAFT_172439 [Cyberlindnera jadinii NRRL Y-1542]ODV74462.1 hypothetical protein CYBJADRAFT_172439 [Cyberlindnera jadinii NRRL Y-1542]